jgi:integrase
MQGVWMVRADRGDGVASMVLVDGVSYLHPEDAVLKAMVAGWQRQQLGGRQLRPRTVARNCKIVEQFVGFSGEYPWKWSAAHMDEWSTHLTAELKRAKSTIRAYQGAIRGFCDYVTSPYYEWPAQCETRFGTHPIQICHEWNTTAHLLDYEGVADRRPMSRKEIQRFLDYADDQVEVAMRAGRKGALAAYRDATIFKVVYGWGLRCNEAAKLDVTDMHRNPEAREFGGYGSIHVRYGKSSKGSAPKRRTVLSLWPWAVEALIDYVENVRPLYRASATHPALWLTERDARIRPGTIEDRFAQYRDALGLDPALVLHCMRKLRHAQHRGRG